MKRFGVMLVLVGLLCCVGRAHALQISLHCQTFERHSDAPDFVRNYLANSADSAVQMCVSPDSAPASGAGYTEAHFSGSTAVSKVSNVCVFTSHELVLSKDAAGRAQLRPAQTDAVKMMSLTSNGCASKSEDAYTITYDLTPEVFASLVNLWGGRSVKKLAR